MSEVTIFAFDSAAVRTLDLNGEPWFVASDVANILGYRDAEKMTRMLDEDEAATHNVGIRSENGVEQMREVTIINESGLYAAILKSRRPEAKAFRKWVTSEVLPSIRKRGSYAVPGAEPACQFVTSHPAHGADLAVAAERTFRSFLRAGRSAGLSLPQALRMANRQTQDRTGLDMLAEMGVEVADAQAAPGVADSVCHFVDDWLAGRLPVPVCICRNADLYAAYVRWCRDSAQRPLADNAFHQAVTRTGHGVQKRHIGSVHRHRAVFPPGAAAAVDGEKGRFYEASLARFAAALVDWQ